MNRKCFAINKQTQSSLLLSCYKFEKRGVVPAHIYVLKCSEKVKSKRTEPASGCASQAAAAAPGVTPENYDIYE